jgi:hypothetical protein
LGPHLNGVLAGLASIGLALAFVAVVVAIASVIPTAMGVRTVLCDGYAEAWMLEDNHAGPGCVEMPPWWEHLVPGHDTTRVCLGMCLDERLIVTAPSGPPRP